jgi:hypothetical protein
MSERTLTCAFLLSTPHPSGYARHLPQQSWGRGATAGVYEENRLRTYSELLGCVDACIYWRKRREGTFAHAPTDPTRLQDRKSLFREGNPL